MPQDTTDPEVQTALDNFDVSDWLSDIINAEQSITVYRDGTTLLQLDELSALAAEASDKAKNANAAELSIADEYDEAAEEAIQAAQAARERLAPSGLTFHLRSIGTDGRDALLKSLERDPRFKEVKKTADTEAIPGGQKHPDFFDAYQEALLARVIIAIEPAGGKKQNVTLTDADVQKFRKLPGFEFSRLWGKVYDLHYKQYDIDRMIDLDFSSRL